MASLSYNSAGVCLLVGILVAVYLEHYDIRTKIDEIRTDNSTTYPELTTPQGKIRGINLVSHRNRTIFGFVGIPFAEAPVGNLRFRAPLPAKAWNGTLDASSSASRCPQLDGKEVIGNEDCLYLNVFTPKLPVNENSTLLPVMVFILGGTFKSGTNTHLELGPEFLLDKDIILLVPNFRLGVLGYLSTGDGVSPGNYGLKDMVQALRWNRDNIRYFGGDPNQVTLFGDSSGAASVHLLTLSDFTKGLFHRYITQGGSALSFHFEQPKEVYANLASKLGEHVGCPTNTSTILVECLRGVNASRLIDTLSLFYQWKTIPDIIWIPNFEPDIEGALLTDSPRKLFAAGKTRDLPWMSSVTSDEGFIITAQFYENPEFFEEFLKDIDFVLPFLIGYANSVNNLTSYTAALKAFYLNDLTADRDLLLRNLTQLLGDAMFNYPVYRGNELQLALAKSSQYLCSFEYRGTFTSSFYFSGGSTKYTFVTHGDELIYLFQGKDQLPLFAPPDSKHSDADWMMVDTMVQLWTSFAINGIPTTANSSNANIWEPYSLRKKYLRIGKGSDLNLELKDDFLKDRMEFWDQLTAATSWK